MSDGPGQVAIASRADREGYVRHALRRFTSYLGRRFFFSAKSNRRVVEAFHKLFYESRVWTETTWQGHQILKAPSDLWNYQELLREKRPDLVVETGTYTGASALYFANLFDLMGHGHVVTVDLEEYAGRPRHPRITYLKGSSIDEAVVAQVRETARGKTALVVLDSAHTRDHVLAELRAYCDLVPPGGSLVVEDTNINGHPVFPEYGPGPHEAVQQFLKERSDFRVDERGDKFFHTMHPNGWLTRVR